MTFSLVGRCPRTGQIGAAVTTSSIAVGARCSFCAAGVGAVLTQHRTDPRLGPKILERLKHGSSPDSIIHDLEKTDPDLRWRQLAVIAADGRGAVFNCAKITSIVKARVGRDCAAVGNILRNTGVVDAMISTFEENENQSLPERLMRAIEAGQAAGGELKQLKSAALLVVHRESFPFVDLRVDLSPQPLVELRFLWELYEPAADNYVVRAVEPDKAPGAG
jgi:uncharacterized Ntn-hydrolase superfamily protein